MKIKQWGAILLLFAILHALFIGTEQILFHFISPTMFHRSMIVMSWMIVYTIALMVYIKLSEIVIKVLPVNFNKKYIAATIVTLVILIATPSNYTGGFTPILMLLYGSIVTPIFEELLFRGVLWTYIENRIHSEKATYCIVTILFAIWHIGYCISLYLWRGGNLWNSILWKVGLAFVYGIIFGFCRYRSKNCYLGSLLHGICNAMAF